jgi:outer membrane receptor protein involved in Fe transport
VLNGVPYGRIKINFAMMGYEPKEIEKDVSATSKDIFVEIELKNIDVEVEGITISAESFKQKINSRIISTAAIRQTTQELQDVAVIAESDVFRSLQMQPGVKPISDFSSGLYVRGGSTDQNLILMDGIDVYNPSHFGGVFSTFNTDAIKNVELIKGGYPAKFGGRLSSVLNIANKDGNRKQFKGVARLSLLSSSMTVESPWKIGKQKGSFMASFRRTYLDLIKKMTKLKLPDYYFYDGHAKVNWDLTSHDKITTSTYFGKDALTLNSSSKVKLSWGNETFSSQWTHIFKPELFSHFTVAGSHFYSKLNYATSSDEFFDRKNNILDGTIKGGFTYTPVDEHVIDFGAEIKLNNMKFETISNMDVDQNKLPKIEVDAHIASAYIQDSWKVGDFWTIQPGLRAAMCKSKNKGKAGKEKTYFRLSPRFSIRRELTETSNVYFTYGRYYQYLSLLSQGEFSAFDLWFPIDKDVPPGKSDHFILGYKTELFGEWGLDIEGYYKDMDNLVEYRQEADYEWDNQTNTLKDMLNLGHGYSYGADILLRNQWNDFSGFIGYSYGVTKKKINSTNVDLETGEEQYYFPKYDKTHTINVVEKYSMRNLMNLDGDKDLTIGMNYTFATGQPFAKLEQIYMYNGDFNQIYGYKDSGRLPNYSRFDLSITYKKEYKNLTLEPYLQIFILARFLQKFASQEEMGLDQAVHFFGKEDVEDFKIVTRIVDKVGEAKEFSDNLVKVLKDVQPKNEDEINKLIDEVISKGNN